MEKEVFAERLAQSMAGSAESILRYAEKPPGRGVTAQRRALADWLATFDAEGRERLLQLVGEGVHAGVFGTLCVLDHVRAVEDAEERGTFTLSHTSPAGETVVLNPDSGEMLHDLYNHFSRQSAT
ncbi:hypothetical protein BOO69_12975 [Sulfitobacter alexandrii]|uniref:Uncharacterized protein n=1 Tax=Sulfitobacter alexandrii TaxID=1917485 RepID=A0A1J0WIR3_9RHOB|nr:hypothetical protein [Sulfitobacter alexandrii]APE44209.1 hypothetical protein BOO69_12975 [Sulfitobacter alexandrii]